MCFLHVADENRKVLLRDWKKTYTLHGNNGRLISERERISPKVSATAPTPSPAFGKAWVIKGEITMQEAVSQSEVSTSRVKPLEYSARALADLADTLIIQTGSQLTMEELEIPKRVRED